MKWGCKLYILNTVELGIDNEDYEDNPHKLGIMPAASTSRHLLQALPDTQTSRAYIIAIFNCSPNKMWALRNLWSSIRTCSVRMCKKHLSATSQRDGMGYWGQDQHSLIPSKALLKEEPEGGAGQKLVSHKGSLNQRRCVPFRPITGFLVYLWQNSERGERSQAGETQ